MINQHLRVCYSTYTVPSTDLTGGLRRTLSPPDWGSAKKRLISINTNKMIWDTIN